MNKVPPVANKICSRRDEELAYAKHLLKLKEIKSNNSQVLQQQYANERVISTSSILRRHDRKKEILNEIYYTEVERENRILLEKMSKIMKQQKPNLSISNSIEVSPNREPKSLNKIIRKRELVRISMENQEILKRIQEKPPTYNHASWMKHHKLTDQYLQNISEFPLIKHSRPITTTNESVVTSHHKDFTRHDILKNRRQSDAEYKKTHGAGSLGPYQRDHHLEEKNNNKKIVLYKKGVRIGLGLYIIEITIDKKIFQISADDVENPDIKFLSFPVDEGKKILSDNNNEYQKLIDKLYFKDGALKLKGYEQTLNSVISTEKGSEIAEKMIEESESDLALNKNKTQTKGIIRNSRSYSKKEGKKANERVIDQATVVNNEESISKNDQKSLVEIRNSDIESNQISNQRISVTLDPKPSTPITLDDNKIIESKYEKKKDQNDEEDQYLENDTEKNEIIIGQESNVNIDKQSMKKDLSGGNMDDEYGKSSGKSLGRKKSSLNYVPEITPSLENKKSNKIRVSRGQSISKEYLTNDDNQNTINDSKKSLKHDISLKEKNIQSEENLEYPPDDNNNNNNNSTNNITSHNTIRKASLNRSFRSNRTKTINQDSQKSIIKSKDSFNQAEVTKSHKSIMLNQEEEDENKKNKNERGEEEEENYEEENFDNQGNVEFRNTPSQKSYHEQNENKDEDQNENKDEEQNDEAEVQKSTSKGLKTEENYEEEEGNDVHNEEKSQVNDTKSKNNQEEEEGYEQEQSQENLKNSMENNEQAIEDQEEVQENKSKHSEAEVKDKEEEEKEKEEEEEEDKVHLEGGNNQNLDNEEKLSNHEGKDELEEKPHSEKNDQEPYDDEDKVLDQEAKEGEGEGKGEDEDEEGAKGEAEGVEVVGDEEEAEPHPEANDQEQDNEEKEENKEEENEEKEEEKEENKEEEDEEKEEEKGEEAEAEEEEEPYEEANVKLEVDKPHSEDKNQDNEDQEVKNNELGEEEEVVEDSHKEDEDMDMNDQNGHNEEEDNKIDDALNGDGDDGEGNEDENNVNKDDDNDMNEHENEEDKLEGSIKNEELSSSSFAKHGDLNDNGEDESKQE